MRSVILVLIVIAASPGALAYDKAQTRKGLEGCTQFLKLSPQEQARAAQRAGYSLSQTRAACRLLVRQGLAKTWKLEREYAARTRARSRKSQPWRAPAKPSCSGSIGCQAGSHCLGGHCTSTIYRCHANAECSFGETCVSGACKD
jgi:hypothetical protein